MGEIHPVRVQDLRAGVAPAGCAFLVDRLWPRGVRKEDLPVEGWLREVAPSSELRRWFGHDPARWEEFARRYAAELDARPQEWAPLLAAAERDDVLLVFAAHDQVHNNAVALRDYLLARGAGRSTPQRR